MNNTPVLVINLLRSPERLAHVRAGLDAQEVAFERLDAIDGKTLSDDTINTFYDQAQNTQKHHKVLAKGEIACYLSHRKAWQHIVDNQLPYALVLEDDVNITGDVRKALDAINTLPAEWDLIKLAGYKDYTRKTIAAVPVQSFELVVQAKTMSGCAAQVISLQGAKKLLKSTQRFYRPVDVDLQYFWEHDLFVYSLLPYCFSQNMDMESDINSLGRNKTTSTIVKLKNSLTQFWHNRRHTKKAIHALHNLVK